MAKQLLNSDVYKSSQETSQDKDNTEQGKTDTEDTSKVDTSKVDTKKVEEKVEEKPDNTEEKEKQEDAKDKAEETPPEEDTGTSLLLKRIDELEKMNAQSQASVAELRNQVKGKSQELDKKHEQLNLEKKTKEELSREIVNLRERITASEKTGWERFNKWLPKQSEKAQKFVAFIKTPQSTPDELIMKLNEAVESGILGNDTVDNSFAVKPVVKSSSNKTQARQLFTQSNVGSVGKGLNNPQKT